MRLIGNLRWCADESHRDDGRAYRIKCEDTQQPGWIADKVEGKAHGQRADRRAEAVVLLAIVLAPPVDAVSR